MKCKINFETLFLLFWFIILIRVSYKIYNSPYKISIFDDQIEFISLSNKKKRIQISDLNQIKVTLYGWVTFHYNGGELTGTKNFNEFKDMINLIKEKNPSVITSGC